MSEEIQIIQNGEKVNIVKESFAQRQVHDWNPKKYKLNSINAIVDLVKIKGNKENTVILYDDKGIDIILDETVKNEPLDHCLYQYAYSLQFRDWNSIFGRAMDQKMAVEFLKSRTPGEINEVESLIANIAKIKLVTTIAGEYSDDNEGNITSIFKEKNGKEHKLTIPKEIVCTMPVFQETEEVQMIFEVKLIKPKHDDEKPLIIFNCCRKDYYIQATALIEVEKLKKHLEGYLILSGRAKN